MKKVLEILVFCFVIMVMTEARAEWQVLRSLEIKGFPEDQGMSVSENFWTEYLSEFQVFADSLNSNPNYFLVIEGWADGTRYNENHDAKNGGLASNRADAAARIFKALTADTNRVLTQSRETAEKGDEYRKVVVKLANIVTPNDTIVAPTDTCWTQSCSLWVGKKLVKKDCNGWHQYRTIWRTEEWFKNLSPSRDGEYIVQLCLVYTRPKPDLLVGLEIGTDSMTIPVGYTIPDPNPGSTGPDTAWVQLPGQIRIVGDNIKIAFTCQQSAPSGNIVQLIGFRLCPYEK